MNDDAIVVGGENETENCQVVYSSSKSLTCRYRKQKSYLGPEVGGFDCFIKFLQVSGCTWFIHYGHYHAVAYSEQAIEPKWSVRNRVC